MINPDLTRRNLPCPTKQIFRLSQPHDESKVRQQLRALTKPTVNYISLNYSDFYDCRFLTQALQIGIRQVG
jgi:hypothetical protein